MKTWLRRAAFSVLWDLGDWAMRTAWNLDDSLPEESRLIDWQREAELAKEDLAELNPEIVTPKTRTNGTVTYTKVTHWPKGAS